MGIPPDYKDLLIQFSKLPPDIIPTAETMGVAPTYEQLTEGFSKSSQDIVKKIHQIIC